MTLAPSANLENKNNSLKLQDTCPDWAASLIQKILVLEVELGTIKNPSLTSDDPNWSTSSLDRLTKIAGQLDRQHLDNIEEEVQTLFAKISRGLLSEGFSAVEVAEFINKRVPTGCRLPYCNASEVQEATAL
jgi:hypothetical protein